MQHTAESFPPATRIWIHQSNKPFKDADVPAIRQAVQQFAQQWVSHNRQLRATGDVLYNQFIVLMVDENHADASGCSIDKSVAFLKALQAQLDVDLFDRMTFAYLENGSVRTASRDQFADLYSSGRINDETLVFDTLVNNKADMDSGFLKPLGKSWHHRFV